MFLLLSNPMAGFYGDIGLEEYYYDYSGKWDVMSVLGLILMVIIISNVIYENKKSEAVFRAQQEFLNRRALDKRQEKEKVEKKRKEDQWITEMRNYRERWNK